MRKTLSSICMAIALAFGIHVQADEPVAGADHAVVGEPIAACDVGGCGCCGGGFVFDAEATFFRYHRTDGVQDQFGNPIEFDFEISPRLTLGYVGCDGLGARVRWWDYHHSNTAIDGAAPGAISVIDVDTYTLDFEIFEQIQLGCQTRLEWSAGIRYVDFQENLREAIGPGFVFGDNPTTFSAPGIIVGLQVNRCTMLGGEIYARARQSILMSDRTSNQVVNTDTFYDVTNWITELAVGYQVSKCLCNGSVLSLRAGVEMQHWANFSEMENTVRDAGGIVGVLFQGGPADVGFGGFVIGGGLNY